MLDKGIGDRSIDNDPFGRHADLPGIGKGAEGGGVDRGIEIGIVEHQQRRLAAELEYDGLQVFGADAAMILPTRVEPVKLTRRTAGCAIIASTIDAGIGRRVGDTVDDAGGKAGLPKRLDDETVRRAGKAPSPSGRRCCRRQAARRARARRE